MCVCVCIYIYINIYIYILSLRLQEVKTIVENYVSDHTFVCLLEVLIRKLNSLRI